MSKVLVHDCERGYFRIGWLIGKDGDRVDVADPRLERAGRCRANK